MWIFAVFCKNEQAKSCCRDVMTVSSMYYFLAGCRNHILLFKGNNISANSRAQVMIG